MDHRIASFGRDERPEGVCLIIAGELDESNGEELYAELGRLIAEARSSAIVDLTAVTFFSSTGIGALLCARARADIRDVKLFIEPSWAVKRILDITDLTPEFNVRD